MSFHLEDTAMVEDHREPCIGFDFDEVDRRLAAADEAAGKPISTDAPGRPFSYADWMAAQGKPMPEIDSETAPQRARATAPLC